MLRSPRQRARRLRALARRTAIAGAIGTAVTGTALALLWQRLLRRPLPREKGALAIEGIAGTIEIARDRWGVPHVTARSRNDLWFGQGFCHGQDRLWQLEIYRRIT